MIEARRIIVLTALLAIATPKVATQELGECCRPVAAEVTYQDGSFHDTSPDDCDVLRVVPGNPTALLSIRCPSGRASDYVASKGWMTSDYGQKWTRQYAPSPASWISLDFDLI